MTVAQFNALPFDERAQCLWDQGRFLTNRHGVYFMCNLKAKSLLLRGSVLPPPNHTIVEVAGFEQTDRLSAYLEEVSLGALLGKA